MRRRAKHGLLGHDNSRSRLFAVRHSWRQCRLRLSRYGYLHSVRSMLFVRRRLGGFIVRRFKDRRYCCRCWRGCAVPLLSSRSCRLHGDAIEAGRGLVVASSTQRLYRRRPQKGNGFGGQSVSVSVLCGVFKITSEYGFRDDGSPVLW